MTTETSMSFKKEKETCSLFPQVVSELENEDKTQDVAEENQSQQLIGRKLWVKKLDFAETINQTGLKGAFCSPLFCLQS